MPLSLSEVFCSKSFNLFTEVRVLVEEEADSLGVEHSIGPSLENEASTSLSVLDEGLSELGLSFIWRLIGRRRLSLWEAIILGISNKVKKFR